MIDIDDVIKACKTLEAYCDSMEGCGECPLEDHCDNWLSPLMAQFIEDLKYD